MKNKTHRKVVLAMLLTSIMVLSVLAISTQLTEAWEYQDGTPGDTLFEEFGPRADRLLIKLYSSASSVWDALQVREIDMTDFPLSKYRYDMYTQPPYSDYINVVPYGVEMGIKILMINHNNNEFLGNPPNPAYTNPMYPNPCSVVQMRQAIAYLVDRGQLQTIIGGGFYVPTYTAVPPSMGAYMHPEILPGGQLEDLTYPYSPAHACALLDQGGFPIGPDGWRFWDRNGNGVKDANEDLRLRFVVTNHIHRNEMALRIIDQLDAVGIHVDRVPLYPSAVYEEVWEKKNFHLFIGGWSDYETMDYWPNFPMNTIRLGSSAAASPMCKLNDLAQTASSYVTPVPEHLMMWNWNNYWHPGYCPNPWGVHDLTLDDTSFGVRYADTEEEAQTNALLFQERFAEIAAAVPLWSYVGYKAMSRTYVGYYGNPEEYDYTGKYWEGAVNIMGTGVDNCWSFLNMHPQGFQRGNGLMTIRYGLSTITLSQLNPVYPDRMVQRNVFRLIYSSLLTPNPYDFTGMPCIAESYNVENYIHPVYGSCAKATFTLRSDVYWSDGTPLTAADVFFTFVELPKNLSQRGYPVPTWFSSVEDVIGFKVLDPHKFEVLLKQPGLLGVLGEIGQQIILPKHIWGPIVTTGNPFADAPDPNMIGSGPWRLCEYISNSHVLMVANKPGSIVQTNLYNSKSVTSPHGYFGYHPVAAAIKADGTTDSKVDYYTSHQLEYSVRNLYYGSITVDITVTHIDETTYSESRQLNPFEYWTHQYNSSITRTRTTSMSVQITSPQELAGDYSWSRVYWGTIKEDITGSTLYDDIGWGTYSYKSQLLSPNAKVDIKDVALAAKGFGSYPGHPNWNAYADINNDYKIDIKDISAIGKKFGWTG